jgi:cell division protein FtsQ
MTRERIDLTGQQESAISGISRKGSSLRTITLEDDIPKVSEGHVEAEGFEDEALQNEDARFLRTEKRVPVRRGPLPRKTAGRLRNVLTLAFCAAVAGGLAAAAYEYGSRAGLFIISSSDNIEITGLRNASPTEVMDVAGEDIGRSVFFVPLDQRRMSIERLLWVESATVMRIFPNRIAVHLVERTPVAFVQIGAKVHLIDAAGVILGPPAGRAAKYSFPVIHGITESEPLSTRAAVMKVYNRLVRELASGDYLQQLSEVDLSDPENVKATVNNAGGTVLVHLGSADFQERYKLFADHIAEWRQQFPKVQSVDMRYDGQIVVNQDREKPVDPVIGRSADRVIGSSGGAGARGTPADHSNTPKAGASGTPVGRKPAVSKEPRRTQKAANTQRPRTKSQKPKTKSKEPKQGYKGIPYHQPTARSQ